MYHFAAIQPRMPSNLECLECPSWTPKLPPCSLLLLSTEISIAPSARHHGGPHSKHHHGGPHSKDTTMLKGSNGLQSLGAMLPAGCEKGALPRGGLRKGSDNGYLPHTKNRMCARRQPNQFLKQQSNVGSKQICLNKRMCHSRP